MRKTRLPLWPIGAVACLVALAVYCPVAAAADKYYVTDDTYIDSTHVLTNYGTANGLKVFVNSTTPNPTHALIQVPGALDGIPAGNLGDVKLWVDNYGGTSLTRAIELHPLTAGFTETGATWNTYDGTNNWTTPGGDYAADHVDVAAPDHDSWYAFDITAMLQGADRDDLLNHGLLLKIYNDTVAPGATTGQNFVSSENASYASFHPYFEVTTVPEPSAVALLAGAAGLAAIAVARRIRRAVK